jgi:hypothetical protein
VIVPKRNLTMHRLKYLALFALLVMPAGCGGLVARQFDSDPTGALIFVNGEPAGTTSAPVEVDFSVTPVVRILIIHENHKPQNKKYTESTFPKKDLIAENAIKLLKSNN